MIEVLPITVLLRDLDVLRAVCRRRGWELRLGQRRYRWFGRRLGDRPLAPSIRADELGHCDHAVGVPGCRYEIGLVWHGDHFLPLWDDGPEDGLAEALGTGGGRLWQSCVTEIVRRAAHQLRWRVSRPADNSGTLRLRLTTLHPGSVAHVRVAGDGTTAL